MIFTIKVNLLQFMSIQHHRRFELFSNIDVGDEIFVICSKFVAHYYISAIDSCHCHLDECL